MNDTANDIISELSGVIDKTISLYSVRSRQYGVDPDDLRQVCRITVWNCLREKQPSDPGFLPYIRTAMRRDIRGYLLKASTGISRRRHDSGHGGKFPTMAELRTVCLDGNAELKAAPEDSQPESRGVISDFLGVCASEDPALREILEMRLSGYNGRHICRARNISYATFRRRLARLKRLYTEYFGETYENSYPEPDPGRKPRAPD